MPEGRRAGPGQALGSDLAAPRSAPWAWGQGSAVHVRLTRSPSTWTEGYGLSRV